jgi:hypothetical protein
METLVKKFDPKDYETLTDKLDFLMKRAAHRDQIRNMPEEEWIDKHASGTLRKNKRIGFSYRAQYLNERVAYEFGWGFQILPRS